MSHPDPLYDDYNDFHDEDDRKNHFDDFEDDSPEFDPEHSCEEEDDDVIVEHDPSDILFAEYLYNGHGDDSMDGDHDSAMTSCGWGTDEDYGYYGDDREDFHSDDGYGSYDD